MASTISVLGEPERVNLSLYELSRRITYCWTSFSIFDRKFGPSGRSRQRGWRCIIGHTLLRMMRWCTPLRRLTLVCEVIRYRLVQVRQNIKKKTFRVGGLQSPSSISSSISFSFILSFVLLSFSIQKWLLRVSHTLMASTISILGEPERVNLVVPALKPVYLLLDIFLHVRSETWTQWTLLRMVRWCTQLSECVVHQVGKGSADYISFGGGVWGVNVFLPGWNLTHQMLEVIWALLPIFFFLRFCRTWTKRYLIISQTRVKRVSQIHRGWSGGVSS